MLGSLPLIASSDSNMPHACGGVYMHTGCECAWGGMHVSVYRGLKHAQTHDASTAPCPQPTCNLPHRGYTQPSAHIQCPNPPGYSGQHLLRALSALSGNHLPSLQNTWHMADGSPPATGKGMKRLKQAGDARPPRSPNERASSPRHRRAREHHRAGLWHAPERMETAPRKEINYPAQPGPQ